MKKTVILSTNNNPDYLNYLPYVQKAWNKLGWRTVTFMVYDTPQNPFNYVNDSSNHHILICNDPAINNITSNTTWRTETVAQVSRLLAAHYVDGMIMTGDVDMIPLANYWHPHPDNVTVYGFDLTGRTQYPICYIAMTADKWRRMIPETSLDELLEKFPNAKSNDFYKWWGVDQEIITERIDQHKRKNELVLIDRGFTNGLAKGRIDRADWERTINSPDTKIDAHMLRPFNLEQTERVMKMIQV
jgi:hypothetical protein